MMPLKVLEDLEFLIAMPLKKQETFLQIFFSSYFGKKWELEGFCDNLLSRKKSLVH